ncbi:unnamed protein product [Cyclocybe aegerita]|uniref:Uncharacterized protein n=1 Tax=Cyclocybe aegerita TaxID=1973307 RepID=A0A8S0VRI3_CYCAE|nr:unnamed protein product [Cyclocybe aegerita]
MDSRTTNYISVVVCRPAFFSPPPSLQSVQFQGLGGISGRPDTSASERSLAEGNPTRAARLRSGPRILPDFTPSTRTTSLPGPCASHRLRRHKRRRRRRRRRKNFQSSATVPHILNFDQDICTREHDRLCWRKDRYVTAFLQLHDDGRRIRWISCIEDFDGTASAFVSIGSIPAFCGTPSTEPPTTPFGLSRAPPECASSFHFPIAIPHPAAPLVISHPTLYVVINLLRRLALFALSQIFDSFAHSELRWPDPHTLIETDLRYNMPRMNLYSRLGVPTTFDAAHKHVTSPFIRSPIIFAAVRLLIAFYMLTTLLVTLIWQSVKEDRGSSYFSYFTYLTFIGLCAHYFAAGTQTFFHALAWRKLGAGAGYPLQRWPRALQAMHVVLQATVVTFPIVVTVVFWALLSNASTFETSFSAWSNISVHALNTVFSLVEILLTNSPPAPWLTLPFCLLFLGGYLGVAYITHETQGFYTYSFLDPKRQGAKLAAYIIGIAVGEIIVFCAIRGLIVLRERWAVRTRRVLDVGDAEGSTGGRESEEWEEVVGVSPVRVVSSGKVADV